MNRETLPVVDTGAPTAAYLVHVCPPLFRAPVLHPPLRHDEELGRGRKPREHRDQELLLADPRDL